MKYGHPDSPEGRTAAEQERERARQVERASWAELGEVYRRCKRLAMDEWQEHLDRTEVTQQTLVKEMNRLTPPIPAPLFTPRDRVQFLKEATVALFIEAGKRNLRATYEPKGELEQAEPAAIGT